jgi:eukaryotic-like serine/threonine-protein kinase
MKPMPLSAGFRLGRYQLGSLIGSGSTGHVYRARDTRSDRMVAVKILASSLAGDPLRLERFASEARTTALIEHPNIVSVFEVGSADGHWFVVSELLEGETLRSKMRGGALPAEIALKYTLHIAQGLVAAHHLGIVHRDLKPENLFVTVDERVKILDFGLARCGHEALLGGAGAKSTQPGTILGTVGYMSPEQVRGATADERSDVFSLGVILYEMVAGAPPFQRETPIETLYAIMKQDPAPLSDRRSTTDLQHVIRHCLEKHPTARFQSARDLAFVLDFTLRAPGIIRRPAPTRRMLSSMLRLF